MLCSRYLELAISAMFLYLFFQQFTWSHKGKSEFDFFIITRCHVEHHMEEQYFTKRSEKLTYRTVTATNVNSINLTRKLSFHFHPLSRNFLKVKGPCDSSSLYVSVSLLDTSRPGKIRALPPARQLSSLPVSSLQFGLDEP